MSEQMYLKCVSNKGSSGAFTVGEKYLVKRQEGSLYYVESNGGSTLDVPLEGSLWRFELIREQPKLTPRSLGCFQEVADVIGGDAAERELQRVIDYSDTEFMEISSKYLTSCFMWEDTPQGHGFWDAIDDGNVPEELQTNHHQISTSGDDSSDNSKPKSTPEFGDVLHIDGNAFVFWRMEGKIYVVVRECSPNPIYVDNLGNFDEYKPNKPQELRNRILERWQNKRLENAWDTELCRTELCVGDLVDFVVENIESEAGE